MPESIDDVCERVAKLQPDTLKACNFFVQAIFRDIFGSCQDIVSGQAAVIVPNLSKPPFTSLKSDAGAAIKHAQDGDIVVGGSVHGQHVFIVSSAGRSKPGQPTPWTVNGKPVLSRGGAPIIYNGSINPKIPTPKSSVDIVFSQKDQLTIVYACLPDPRKK
jgi:hypothetical protein